MDRGSLMSRIVGGGSDGLFDRGFVLDRDLDAGSLQLGREHDGGARAGDPPDLSYTPEQVLELFVGCASDFDQVAIFTGDPVELEHVGLFADASDDRVV